MLYSTLITLLHTTAVCYRVNIRLTALSYLVSYSHMCVVGLECVVCV